MECAPKKSRVEKKIRDSSHFLQDAFNMELLQIDWKSSSSVDESFAQFYIELNKLINKHAPLKLSRDNKLSNLQNRGLQVVCENQLKLRISYSDLGDTAKYKQYRNKISNLTRLSKKFYYQAFFEANTVGGSS